MHDDVTVEQRVLERISVSRPYFDLRELDETGTGIVEATIPVQAATAPEAGPVEAAQVARHLAILGSCAVALTRDDDKRHHYLATRAHYTRMANAPGGTAGPLRARAIGSWIDRRSARALVTLSTADGQGLNLLDVEYTVLAPRMFARLNPPIEPAVLEERADEMDLGAPSIQPGQIERTGDGLRVDAGPIPVAMCAGHFPDYPAAPVAIVMGRLCQTAGLAMMDHLGLDGRRYRIEEGRVEATALARAGQRLVLEAGYAEPVPGGHRLTGRAVADGVVVGEVDVVLSIHGPSIERTEYESYRDALIAVEPEPDGSETDGSEVEVIDLVGAQGGVEPVPAADRIGVGRGGDV